MSEEADISNKMAHHGVQFACAFVDMVEKLEQTMIHVDNCLAFHEERMAGMERKLNEVERQLKTMSVAIKDH